MLYLGSNKGGLREKGAGRADEALENPFFRFFFLFAYTEAPWLLMVSTYWTHTLTHAQQENNI